MQTPGMVRMAVSPVLGVRRVRLRPGLVLEPILQRSMPVEVRVDETGGRLGDGQLWRF